MTDVMRQVYRPLKDNERHAMERVKREAGGLYDYINSFGQSRELSVAKTKIEEAVMWAVKHVTGAGLIEPIDPDADDARQQEDESGNHVPTPPKR